jgi:hypothetical protein
MLMVVSSEGERKTEVGDGTREREKRRRRFCSRMRSVESPACPWTAAMEEREDGEE